MVKKGIKSTIVVLLLLGIFTGLAAATSYLEPSDLMNYKSTSNKDISVPYGTSTTYSCTIGSTSSDVDWCKFASSVGDHQQLFIDADAYLNYIAGYMISPQNQQLGWVSYMNGNSGPAYAVATTTYLKFLNEKSRTGRYYFYLTRSAS
jgi:hypothetical protein